jgi:hypothetical protein
MLRLPPRPTRPPVVDTGDELLSRRTASARLLAYHFASAKGHVMLGFDQGGGASLNFRQIFGEWGGRYRRGALSSRTSSARRPRAARPARRRDLRAAGHVRSPTTCSPSSGSDAVFRTTCATPRGAGYGRIPSSIRRSVPSTGGRGGRQPFHVRGRLGDVDDATPLPEELPPGRPTRWTQSTHRADPLRAAAGMGQWARPRARLLTIDPHYQLSGGLAPNSAASSTRFSRPRRAEVSRRWPGRTPPRRG